MENLNISKGSILIYRVFDIGESINIENVAGNLFPNSPMSRFKLKKITNAVIINNAPLSISLGQLSVTLGGVDHRVDLQAKIWSFGAISLNFIFSIDNNFPLKNLIEHTSLIENSKEFNDIVNVKIHELTLQIDNIIQNKKIWKTHEDYVIYYIQEFSTQNDKMDLQDLINKNDILFSVLINEGKEVLSEQLKNTLKENIFQYSKNDMVIIDWNSAIIIEPSGDLDIPDIIEFSLCQLLELRYYDDLLDKELNALYKSIDKETFNILSKNYVKTSREAAKKYIEISEIIENIENSLKVVGDFYYAKIFRAVSNKFRSNDWTKSVNEKLNNLAEISKLLQHEISERRSTYMEMIIIILISIELIPLLVSALQGVF
ncbi:MAG: hypothetical protein U0T83_10420 [Bacteriovoracaceae bacterium]